MEFLIGAACRAIWCATMGTDDDPGLELDWKGRAPRGKGAPEPTAKQQGLAQAGKGFPGDPQHMSDELRQQLHELLVGPGLRVAQFRETLQILAGWDQANQYEVSSLEGRPVFYAAEKRGVLSALLRNFNPFHQRHVECLTLGGTVAMTVDFPFTLFFRRGDVRAWDGRVMGKLQQRFSLLRVAVDVQTPGGVTKLTIRGPTLKILSFSDWVFTVRQGEQVVARIKKHWAGWFAETFSNADNFSIEFESGCDGRMRQLLVAAALTLDLVGFEQKGNRGSLLNKLLRD
jgi:hypothetical protein